MAKNPRKSKKKSSKIVQYKKPLNINIGMVIFAVLFVYILICVYMALSSNQMIPHEVSTGSLSISSIYKGLALRQEEIITSNGSGYINYFAREGEHVGVGNLVYTLDESGRLADLINSENESVQLSGKDLNELETEINMFRHTFSPKEFNQIYDFKHNIKGSVLKYSNYNMLNSIDEMSNGGNGVNFCNAPKSGVVVYSIDGYETIDPMTVSENSLDYKAYEKKQLISNELISNGDHAYKLVTAEEWSIMIAVTPERAQWMEEEEYVNVKFLKNQYTAWGKVTIHRRSEEEIYAQLDFTNSMIPFVSDRFIDIEVLSSETEGLKIPNSAIVEKEFYLIPKEYIVKGGNSSKDGFMREGYDEGGNITTEFVETTIYSESDTDYYVDTITLRIGDQINMQDSNEKYPISKSGTLIGVYNMDKGYADFKEITILESNEEYSIVKSNTTYGLRVYDHIVLNAESVHEDEFVH